MDVNQLKTFCDKNMVTEIRVKPWCDNPGDGWVIEATLISGETVQATKVRSNLIKIYKSVDGTYSDLLSIGIQNVNWTLN